MKTVAINYMQFSSKSITKLLWSFALLSQFGLFVLSPNSSSFEEKEADFPEIFLS